MWLIHKLLTSTLVDTTVLYAFWPIKKKPIPLLYESDLDEVNTHVRISSEASKTVNSDLSEDSQHSKSPV